VAEIEGRLRERLDAPAVPAPPVIRRHPQGTAEVMDD
jgi:hypothetical protein